MTLARHRTRLAAIGLLLTGVVASGSAGPAAAVSSPVAWTFGQPCPDAIVVGAAGSGQLDAGSEDGMGAQVDGVFRAIVHAGRGLEIAAFPLPYPAAPVFPTSGYLESVELGLQALASTVAGIAGECPTTGIVLAGYSQGAHVIQRGLERLPSSDEGGEDLSRHIDAVVLLASPLFTRQAGATQFDNFDPGRRGLLGGRAVPAWIVEDTITWCRSGDLVCQGGGGGDLLSFDAATSRSIHSTYRDDATRRIVGSLVVGRLDAVPAAPPRAEPGPPPSTSPGAQEADRPLGPGVTSTRSTNEILARDVRYSLPPDARDSSHREGIARVLASGVMSGFADGTFGPSADLTRGQAATVLVNAFELPRTERVGAFTDTAGSVHDRAIGTAADVGLVNGFPDGSFRPNQSVTRAQFVTMLANGLGLREAYDPSWAVFDDVAAGSVHRPAIMTMTRVGLIAGVADGRTSEDAAPAVATTRRFAPGQPVTRAQAATLVARSVIQRLASDPDRHLVGVWERWGDDAYCTRTLVAPNPYAPSALSVRQVIDGGAETVGWGGGSTGNLTASCRDLGEGGVEPYVIELWVQPDAEESDPDSWARGPDNGTLITWLRRDPR